MKKLNLNKKGFTLIELLAVIVILALLVAVAVPAVTRYLNTARAGVFANDAATAISAVRNEVMASNVLTTNTGSEKISLYLYLEQINNLLESSKQMKNSSYGPVYQNETSYVKVEYTPSTGRYEYCIYLNDGQHMIDAKEENVASSIITPASVATKCQIGTATEYVVNDVFGISPKTSTPEQTPEQTPGGGSEE